MRVLWVVFLVGCLILPAMSWGVYVPGLDQVTDRTIELKGQFIVRFADGVTLNGVEKGFGLFRLGIPSVDRVLDDFEANEVRSLSPFDAGTSRPMSRIYVVQIPKDKDDAAFLRAMEANPNVASIEHDVACRVFASPNDPSHNSQWAYKAGSQLLVHEAWDIETGSDTTVIGFIDTGVNYRHGDLKNNIWVNPGEDIDGDMVVFDSTDFDGVDNDGNGYTDDVVGYDFLQSAGAGITPWPGEDASVKDNDPNDFNGHGTACAGVAAAVTNNSTGVAGLAGGWGPSWRGRGAQIMCLRAGLSARNPSDTTEETGYLIMSAVVEAINYAVHNGADVISYSAGSSNVTGMSTALASAMSAGIVFCNAAGNDNSSTPDYFGTYSGVITVAATSSDDRKASYSNYGTWVEVSAPGDEIYSTNSYHYSAGYAYWWGTSFSAPMTAGLAGLIKSHYPAFTKTQIDTIIINNADNIDALNPSYVGLLGSGRINAYNTLSHAAVAKFGGAPQVGAPPLTVNFADSSPAATSWSWDFGDGGVSYDRNPSHTYDTPGLFPVSLQVQDPNGTDTEIKKYYVFAMADTLQGGPVSAASGVSFAVPVYLKNSVWLDEFVLAFTFPTSGSPSLSLDGYTTAGTRSENFSQVQAVAQSLSKIAIRFVPTYTTGKNALPPGDGAVVNLWFTASGSGTAVIDTSSLNNFGVLLYSRLHDYRPSFVPISVRILQCGDANGDGNVNVGDAVFVVNYVFRGGPAPDPICLGDANGDGNVNVGDAVYIVNYIFRGGYPPVTTCCL